MKRDNTTSVVGAADEFLDTAVGNDLYSKMHVVVGSKSNAMESTAKKDKISKVEENEFRVFQDYLGLINIIQPEGSPYSVDSPNSESSSLQSFDGLFDVNAASALRNRMNSFDSDKSESSSQDSRSDSDMFEIMKPIGRDYSTLHSAGNNNTSSSEIGQALLRHQTNDHRRPVSSKSRRVPNTTTATNYQENIYRQGVNNGSQNQRNVCVFCRNNGESREFYTSHSLKNTDGKTSCPILRAYTCPLCKANGDESHTIKYCPRYTPKPKENFMPL